MNIFISITLEISIIHPQTELIHLLKNHPENVHTSSDDSSSDSSLDRSSRPGEGKFGRWGGGEDGGGGWQVTAVGSGGVGSATRNGAGIFILFIKCKT